HFRIFLMSRKIILIKQELLLLVYELNRSGLLAENEKIRPILAQLEKLLLCDLSPSTNDSVKNYSSEISESVNFCVMEAIKLCRLDTPIIFIEARINLSRFVVTGCAAKTSATVTFPSLNLISLFAFCFNIWLNGVA